MRKCFLSVALATMLLITGCAAIQRMLNNAAIDLICSPTPEQQQTAAQMLAALDIAQDVAAGFYPPLSIFKASAVLSAIRDGGCFLVAELKAAFEAVDAANTASARAHAMVLKGAVAYTVPEYPALRRMVK